MYLFKKKKHIDEILGTCILIWPELHTSQSFFVNMKTTPLREKHATARLAKIVFRLLLATAAILVQL